MKLLGESKSKFSRHGTRYAWLLTVLLIAPLLGLLGSIWLSSRMGLGAARLFVAVLALALSVAIAWFRIRGGASDVNRRPLAPFILWAVAVGAIFLLIAGEWRLVGLGGLLVFASFVPARRRSLGASSISCPHCGYDRSGIGARGKCPECGRGMWL